MHGIARPKARVVVKCQLVAHRLTSSRRAARSAGCRQGTWPSVVLDASPPLGYWIGYGVDPRRRQWAGAAIRKILSLDYGPTDLRPGGVIMRFESTSSIKTYQKSGEYRRALKNYLDITINPDDVRRYAGPYKRDLVVSFGRGPYETLYLTDILYVMQPRIFQDEVDHASGCSISALNSLRRRWRRPIARFVVTFCSEIRARICPKKGMKLGKSADGPLSAAIAAMSAWMCVEFGLTEPIAVGLATAVMFLLVESFHGTFCKLTQEKVKSVLDEKYPPKDKNVYL